ncbi:MAG: hypothetical protein AAFO29_19270 [Actinomycetota bacterium]
MRVAVLLLTLGLVGLLVADGLTTDPGTWTPVDGDAPTFDPNPTDPVDDHDHTHQPAGREWCWMSIGDNDGDGFSERVPCDPDTRAAATVSLDGLHSGADRFEVAP